MVNKNLKFIGIGGGIIVAIIIGIIVAPDLLSRSINSDQSYIQLGKEQQESFSIAGSDGFVTQEELQMIEQELLDRTEKIIIENMTNNKPSDDIPLISLVTTETFSIEANILITDSLANEISSLSTITQFQPQSLITSEGVIIDLGKIDIQFLAFIPDSKIDATNPPTYIIDGKLEITFNDQIIESKQIFNDGLFLENPQIIKVADSRLSPFGERRNSLSFDFIEINQELPNLLSVNLFIVSLKDLTATITSKGVSETFVVMNPIEIYRLEIEVDESKIVKINEQGQVVEIPKSDGKVILCATALNGGTLGGDAFADIPDTTFEVNGEIILSVEGFRGKLPLQKSTAGPTCKTFTGLPRNSEIIVNLGDEFILTANTPSYQRNHIIHCNIFGYGQNGCNLYQSLDPNFNPAQFYDNNVVVSFLNAYSELGFID